MPTGNHRMGRSQPRQCVPLLLGAGCQHPRLGVDAFLESQQGQPSLLRRSGLRRCRRTAARGRGTEVDAAGEAQAEVGEYFPVNSAMATGIVLDWVVEVKISE